MNTEVQGGCVTCPGHTVCSPPRRGPTHTTHYHLSHNIPWLCPDDVKKQLGFSQIDYGASPLRNVPIRTHYTGMYSLASATWRPSCRRWPGLLSSCRSCGCQANIPQFGSDEGANDRWMNIQTQNETLKAGPKFPVFTGPQMKSPGCL